MRFLCLGFHDEAAWNALSPEVRQQLIDESLAYEAELKASGRCLGGIALEGVASATTIRFSPGKTLVTDGPFAETKEQLGGFMIIEAADMQEAVAIVRGIPCMKLGGTAEIRPVQEELSTDPFQRETTTIA
jgi:hypothetical protein